MIREALALHNALLALGCSLKNCRIDAQVDNQAVVQAWRNQGSKSKELSEVIKSNYETALKFNMALSIFYVPSSEILADTPSRALSPNDCMLAPLAWDQVEKRWGPHTLDLMALDSNVQRGRDGLPLPH